MNTHLNENGDFAGDIFNPNFALEGASDVLVLSSRGAEEKRRRTRRMRSVKQRQTALPL